MKNPTVADHEVDLEASERGLLGAPPTRRFDGWGVIELMGHVRVAGYVAGVEHKHMSFVRIDIPDTPNGKPATKYFSPRSIFCVTPTDEAEARQVATEEAERANDVWHREF